MATTLPFYKGTVIVYFMMVPDTRSELRKFGYKRMYGARDFVYEGGQWQSPGPCQMVYVRFMSVTGSPTLMEFH